MRRFFLTVLLAGLLVAPASTAAARAPFEHVDEASFFIFFDEDNRLVVFGNITRDDFCRWWSDEDAEGEAPVVRRVPTRYITTGQGALVGRFDASVHLELWQPDADVPADGGPGPCEDTEGQDGPWATGTARWSSNDNDLDVSLTRTNSFGARVDGIVTDTTGARWRYTVQFRAQIFRDDSFVGRVFSTSLRSVR